jgi:hypothetical protein
MGRCDGSPFFCGGWYSIYYGDFSTKEVFYRYKYIDFIIVILFLSLFFLTYQYGSERLMIIYQYFSGMLLVLTCGNCKGCYFRLEEYSFFVYCTHTIVLKILKPIYVYVFGESILSAIVWMTCGPALIVVICILIAYILKKYTNPAYKIITGNR